MFHFNMVCFFVFYFHIFKLRILFHPKFSFRRYDATVVFPVTSNTRSALSLRKRDNNSCKLICLSFVSFFKRPFLYRPYFSMTRCYVYRPSKTSPRTTSTGAVDPITSSRSCSCKKLNQKQMCYLLLCHFGSRSGRGQRFVLGRYHYPDDVYADDIEQAKGNDGSSLSTIYVKCALYQ